MWRDDLCRRYGTAAIPLCDLAHKGLQVEAMREAIRQAIASNALFPSIRADLEQALKMNEEGLASAPGPGPVDVTDIPVGG
jgi:hypothetical protein